MAVVGCGPVGFFCIQAARALGAGRVFAIDLEPGRLALAERVGAVPVNARERHPASALADATDGRGADVVLEAVGTPSAFESAVGIVRRGGRVVVVGVYAGESVELQLGVYWARALTLRFAGICPVHAWWERAMDEVVRGRIDPTPLISHRLPLEEAARWLRAVRPPGGDEGRVAAVKVVYGSDEPSGLATMVGGLIDQNLERDPARRRLLRPSSATITVPDAGVAVTVRTGPGGVEVLDGTDPDAQVAITADSDRLLGLTTAPLRFGLPDPIDPSRSRGHRRRAVGAYPHPRSHHASAAAGRVSRPCCRWR